MMVLERLKFYNKLFGLPGTFSWTLSKLSRVPWRLYEFQDSRTGKRMSIRMGTTDAAAYEQVIFEEEYKIELSEEPQYIVDCGANIGLASLYFHARYPDAKIIAVEAEPSNFALLEKNTAAIENITPVHGAIWPTETILSFEAEPESHWGARAVDREAREDGKEGSKLVDVNTITMSNIMRDHALPHIGLLKIDIEGAERALFSSHIEWLDKVHTIAIELHDRYEPGCTETFNGATRDFSKRWQVGENTFVSRELR
ncbi:MAG: FkbM family methyltransferase [bacterium]